MDLILKYNKQIYKINTNQGLDISIPIQFNSDNNPKFYNEKDPINKYYKSNGVEYNLKNGGGCNVPTINMNIHCSGTHTETASHVFQKSYLISDIKNLNYIPSQLVTIIPDNKSKEKYHANIEDKDLLITKKLLENKIDQSCGFIDGIIVRTLPNNDDKKVRNYNRTHHAYFTTDSILFLKKLGVKHIVVDTPSIDKYDDGGKLQNHKIFFTNQKGKINKNTITELCYIPNSCEDGKYLLSIGVPSFNLDAAPSKPTIYKAKKDNYESTNNNK